MNHAFPIILLAAGQSTRMRGRDKLLEQVDGQPLLRRQAMMACSATDGPVVVALPLEPHARHDALGGLSVTRVPVPDATEGMNASLRAAFAALPSGARAAMILLADLPELTLDDLNTVFDSVDLASEMTIWRGATADGKPGHPIVFAACHFPYFAKLTGDSGGRDVVAKAKDRTMLVPLPADHARLDLDTPEDWAAWRQRHA